MGELHLHLEHITHHIIKHHITPQEVITRNHTIVHLMVATVPTKSVRPITRQFTKLSLNTRRSNIVKMFPRKFASILRKKFAINQMNMNKAILQGVVTIIITNTGLRFAILKAESIVSLTMRMFVTPRLLIYPTKNPKRFPTKFVIFQNIIPMEVDILDMENNFDQKCYVELSKFYLTKNMNKSVDTKCQ